MNKIRRAHAGIAWRLGGGFAALLALLLLCTGTALWQINRLGNAMTAVLDGDVRASQAAIGLEALVHGIGVDLRQAILTDAGSEVQAKLTSALEQRARLLEVHKSLESTVTGDAETLAAKAVAAAIPAFLASVDATAASLKGGDSDEARGALTKPANIEARKALVKAVADMVAAANAGMVQARADSQQLQMQAQAVLGALAVVAALAAVAIGWMLTRGVVQPVGQAIAVARRIAGGQLTEDVLHERHDELGDLLDEMQAMQAALRTIVADVRHSAESIQSASDEVSSGNADLSVRTEQAASSLQQTASSMEQLSSTVRQSADSAAQANRLAMNAADVARRGGEVVSAVVSTMGEINASSKRIADIVGVIDGIAFQTNILALNAAVEAARAGEQGRGFAVVASEVRTLAHRSAEAAREIKSLIASSVERVEQGASQVSNAGATMEEIVSSVQRVTDIIGEITSAANEQTSGIGEVNTAVGQLDRMTQQNAALVEQATAAAQSMNAQARRLVDAVRVFALADARPAAVADGVMG